MLQTDVTQHDGWVLMQCFQAFVEYLFSGWKKCPEEQFYTEEFLERGKINL